MTEPCNDLFDCAIQGDEAAWAQLFATYNSVLLSIANSFRLNHEQAEDAAQTTWLLLLKDIRKVREPEKVGAWLSVAMRRQCIRMASSRAREDLRGDWRADEVSTAESPEDQVLCAEAHAELWRAIGGLPLRQRQVLEALSATPRPSYRRVAAQLAMPVGSVGPTRDRALRRLGRLLAEPNRIAPTSGAGRRVQRLTLRSCGIPHLNSMGTTTGPWRPSEAKDG
jgi:RNA polymerase sigma factor (sigma-70 family)